MFITIFKCCCGIYFLIKANWVYHTLDKSRSVEDAIACVIVSVLFSFAAGWMFTVWVLDILKLMSF